LLHGGNYGGNKMSKIIELKDKFKSEFMDPDSVKKLVRYLIVGISTFIIEYSLFLFFREILPLHELITNIIVYSFIFWFNFLMNKFFTFKSRKNLTKQLISYGLLFLFNAVVGNILLFTGIKMLLEYLFPTTAWIPYYLPKILIMVFIVSWNFVLYKKVIYNE
jgi:putative flippase GtrA